MGEKLVEKEKKQPRFLTRNVNIVITKIFAASMLLFCLCFFLFSNISLVRSDFTSWMVFAPLVLIVGICFIGFYIVRLVITLETGAVQFADRFDIVYRLTFSIVLTLLIVRSFLGDFNNTLTDSDGNPLGTNLSVPIGIIVTAIISGIITWVTPKIRDNDNTEF